jgi:hypothetical protein
LQLPREAFDGQSSVNLVLCRITIAHLPQEHEEETYWSLSGSECGEEVSRLLDMLLDYAVHITLPSFSHHESAFSRVRRTPQCKPCGLNSW